jgi:hypothetical protein
MDVSNDESARFNGCNGGTSFDECSEQNVCNDETNMQQDCINQDERETAKAPASFYEKIVVEHESVEQILSHDEDLILKIVDDERLVGHFQRKIVKVRVRVPGNNELQLVLVAHLQLTDTHINLPILTYQATNNEIKQTTTSINRQRAILWSAEVYNDCEQDVHMHSRLAADPLTSYKCDPPCVPHIINVCQPLPLRSLLRLLNKIQVFRPWEDEFNAYQERLQQRLKQQQQQQRFRHIGDRKRKWLRPMNLEITIDGITDSVPFSWTPPPRMSFKSALNSTAKNDSKSESNDSKKDGLTSEAKDSLKSESKDVESLIDEQQQQRRQNVAWVESLIRKLQLAPSSDDCRSNAGNEDEADESTRNYLGLQYQPSPKEIREQRRDHKDEFFAYLVEQLCIRFE